MTTVPRLEADISDVWDARDAPRGLTRLLDGHISPFLLTPPDVCRIFGAIDALVLIYLLPHCDVSHFGTISEKHNSSILITKLKFVYLLLHTSLTF